MNPIRKGIDAARVAFRLLRRTQYLYRRKRSELAALFDVLEWRSALLAIAAYERPLINRPVVVLRLKRHPCSIKLRQGTSDLSAFRQVFIDRQYRGSDSEPPAYVVDAGANIGLSSLFFLTTFPACRVVAIEPHPENVAVARENLAAFSDRCRIIAGAVWPRDGRICVERGAFRDGDYWSCTTQEPQGETGAESLVPAARLETIVGHASFPRIDLLKIDIEGAEVPVFEDPEATFLEATKEVMIECHGSHAELVVTDALRKHGFTWNCRGEVLHAVRSAAVPEGLANASSTRMTPASRSTGYGAPLLDQPPLAADRNAAASLGPRGSCEPLISVIMPVYNTARYLRPAVESILSQTLTDFEFIIVNDGSTDDSTSILREYAARDTRIVLLEQANTGYSSALNRAIDLARGRFLARMDSDDVSLPRRFELQSAFLEEHSEVVVVGGQGLVIDEEGDCLHPFVHPPRHREIDERLLGSDRRPGSLTHPAVMMSREAVLQIGRYRTDFEPAEDRDLFLRLAEIGQLANLTEPVLHYRTHSQSTSRRRAEQQHQQARRAIEEAHGRRGLAMPETIHIWSLEERLRGPLQIMEGFALSAARNGFRRSALKHAARVLRRNPARWTAWKAALIAALGPRLAVRIKSWVRFRLRPSSGVK